MTVNREKAVPEEEPRAAEASQEGRIPEASNVKDSLKQNDSKRSSEVATLDEPLDPAEIEGLRSDLYDEEEYSLEEYLVLLEMYDETLSNIEEGEIVKGRIHELTDTHVVLDVGYKSEGTVPIEEFKDLETLEVGQEVDVYLENLEDKEGSLVLSKKKADFLKVWDKIRRAYEDDDIIEGTISRRIKGGAVVDLLGVDAFLPGSQIALRRVSNIEDLIGETYRFKILKLNKRRRNIVVSRRAILEEEREKKRATLMQELQIGQVRKGVVKNITDFGAFIDLGGADGLLHITDMAWGRVAHPSDVVSIGDEVEVKVLDLDFERERISLGLKQLQSYPWEGVAERFPVGKQVKGRVVSITNYGAFVELEPGVEGLVHISEMSWTRGVKHPSQLVSIGGEAEIVVLGVDEEGEKISLGMKQLEEDPFVELAERYAPGTRIKGTVRNLTNFGAFVEVEPGIDGLVHISDMSWTKRVMHPSEVVGKGEEIEVVVLNVDVERRRISLGLKQVQEDPWEKLNEEYPVGAETSGCIVRLLDKGVIVDLGGDVEGFVPISQLGVRNLKSPEDAFKEGNELRLQVIEFDSENRRIVLSVIERLDQPGAEAPSEEEAEEATAVVDQSAETGEEEGSETEE